MTFEKGLLKQGTKVLNACKRKELKLATAESCTGGLITSLLTTIAGSSNVLDRGFITYSNESKIECLNVPSSLIKNHGAVSMQVAKAMAEGVLTNSNANLSLSITGVAGPSGGTKQKPVGLVYIGSTLTRNDTIVSKYLFGGDRNAVRLQAVTEALNILSRQLQIH